MASIQRVFGCLMQRTAGLTVLLPLLMFFSPLRGQAQGEDPAVRAVIDAVSRDSLLTTVRVLSGKTSVVVNDSTVIITSRSRNTPGRRLARAYLEAQLRRWGYTVTRQVASGADDLNLIAVRTGLQRPGRQVVLCAHYDDVSGAKGADDNASGTAAVLEGARLLRSTPLENTVVFALFDIEELGMVGSQKYADSARMRQDTIIAAVNIDMIGYDGDDDRHAELHVGNMAASLALANTVRSIDSVYALGLTLVTQKPGTSASDHSSFWSAGYPALLLIEEYAGGDFNPNYHTAGDTVGLFNREFFTQCVQLAVGSVASLAGPTTGATGVTPPFTVARRTSLEQNYPNPFNPSTTIRYTTATSSRVQLFVYDILGRVVARLMEGEVAAGGHLVRFDASGLASGVYFCRLVAVPGSGEAVVQTRAMLLAR